MVSAEPYVVGELVVMMIASYVLWLMIAIVEAIHAYVAEGNLFKSVFTKLGELGGVIALGGAGCIVVMLVQLLPIRFGTLMFFNGMLFAALVRSAWFLFRAILARGSAW